MLPSPPGPAACLPPPAVLHVPIYVYLANAAAGRGGFIPIQKYGEQYTKATKDRARRRPVRLLYSNGNHYDLLVC